MRLARTIPPAALAAVAVPAVLAAILACASNHPAGPPPPDSVRAAAFLDTLEERTFHYVWSLANTSSLWMAVMEDQVPRRARRSGDPASNQHLTSGVLMCADQRQATLAV